MHDIQALRDGLAFCREAVVRFPDMDADARLSFEELRATMLKYSGQIQEAAKIYEEMSRSRPDSARGYVLLADLYGWESRFVQIRPDWQRAEQYLRQALLFAKDCRDWDVESRLNEVLKKAKGNNESGE